MKEEIKELMQKEHEQIIKFLDKFEKNKSKENLMSLKTLVEKHFFIEEKIIFRIYSLKNGNEDILDLVKEHKDILWIIEKFNQNLEKNVSLEISEIKEILKSHLEYENEFFYDLLEKELDEQSKNLILNQCKDASCKALSELKKED